MGHMSHVHVDMPGGLVWTLPLRCLRARSSWAHNGTPPVYAPPLHFSPCILALQCLPSPGVHVRVTWLLMPVCVYVRLCVYVCLIMHVQDLLLQEPNQRENEWRCAKRTSLVGQREELQVSWARLFVWVSSVGVMLLCRTRR